jgi:hypothetical protein
MRIPAAGVWLLLLRRGRDLAGLCGRGPSLLGCGLSCPGNKESCYQQAEDESADVAKNATPPPFALGLTSPKFASMSW